MKLVRLFAPHPDGREITSAWVHDIPNSGDDILVDGRRFTILTVTTLGYSSCEHEPIFSADLVVSGRKSS